MPETQITRPQEQDAENFQQGLRLVYETWQRSLREDEEIAGFYEGAKGVIRVYTVHLVSYPVLILIGWDEEGNKVTVAGHYTSMSLTYRKVRVGPDNKRIPIEFPFAAKKG